MLLRSPRCVDYAAVVVSVCVAFLAKDCVCDPEGHEGLDKRQLVEYYKKGLFILESDDLHQCISVGPSHLMLEDCERPSRYMLWKWASRHRLFNLGTNKCLGLNISDTVQSLSMFDCDTTHPFLWWRCRVNSLSGPSNWRLSVSGHLVIAKKNSYHQWKRHNTPKEGPCSYPYEDIHTLLGNAHGMPCAFPFKYNNKWYSECTTEGREDHLPWCATTTHYDEAERWGFCPVEGSTCDPFWELNHELRACYQFNLNTILTWSQALSTCRAQGGDLLSITSLSEHRYVRDRLASAGARVWIGLNHLKDGRGWQWSDGSPLLLVNFTTALPSSPLKEKSQCGVYNPGSEDLWQGLPCESALPYICKKTPNDTRTADPFENWQYVSTDCDSGWSAQNGYCYRVTPETRTWQDSARVCESQGANLTSLRTLAELEMLLNVLKNQKSTNVWLGLWKQASSPVVEWLDGSPVTFTLWHQYQPPHNLTDAALCAKADRKEGNWLLTSCDELLPAVCRKTGHTPVSPSGSWDDGCAEGWKRHGHYCYTVTSYEHYFDDAVIEYYCKGSLLTVENRFEQAFINSLLSDSGANSSTFYWIGLHDQDIGEYRWIPHNNSEVPLTFTNWNRHQPVSAGGCVAMSGGPALGRWEVKHCQSFKAYSVCKRSVGNYLDAQLPEDHRAAYTPCPPGWESQPGMLHCFKIFHDEKVLMKRSWVEADFFCQALGAELASFHNYEEQLMVKNLLSNMFEGTEGRWFWMGLNKKDPENPTSWQWSDDTPVVTSFVEDKNEEPDGRDCAVFSHMTNSFLPRPCDKKYEWICKMHKGDQLLKPYWYTEQSEPWVFYRGAEYLLAKQPFRWDVVSLACQMMGAYLLSIHSKEELHFIKERLRRFSLGPTEWWIGLSLGLPGTEARWTDGTEIEFQNWSEAISRSTKKGMCVTMSSSTGKWSASKCSDLHGYVCKRRTVSVVETPREPHYVGACPEKWLYFGHKCLLLHLPEVPEDGRTWNDAESICSSFGGTLVAIENEIEQAYITMLLQGSSVGLWIGLQNDDTMAWTSGKAVTYTNWSPVEPKSHLTGDEWLDGYASEPLCTVMSNNHNFHLTGKWYDEKCSTSGYGFVCQKPQDTSKPPTHSFRQPVSENIEYRSHNYKVVSGNMSWYDAMHSCSESHSHLVSITDAYHQAFLTVLVNRLAAPHWIGLYSQDSGINYQWSDGSDTVFTHWDSADEEEEDFITGDCVFMDVNGGWRRADCESTLPGALCHVPVLINKAISTNEVACPWTWVKFGGGCYNFESVVQRLTLEEAREHCRQKVNTSDVLTIETETENRFILEQLWSLGFVHQAVWLGMILSIDSDTINWVDGTPIDYTNWPSNPPEPSQLATDTCVSTKAADGVWYLTQCREHLGFVCKTSSHKVVEVEAEPLNGLHHGVIAAAVLVAVVVFALLAGAFWFAYKRNAGHFRGLHTIGSAYYRQTSSQATESDGNVLITDLESRSGE